MTAPQNTLPEKAAAYFAEGYNCAQSVLLTMQEHYGTSSRAIPKIAAAFSGGVGLCGSLCGALTGAIMAIGLRYGTHEPGREKRERACALGRRFYDAFIDELGSPFCRDLIGYDLTDSHAVEEARNANVFETRCSRFVEQAIEILLRLEV